MADNEKDIGHVVSATPANLSSPSPRDKSNESTQPDEGVAWSPLTSLWQRSKRKIQQNEIATQPSVFDDPALAKFYEPHPKYENLHRFDPSFRWTWSEEIPLIRKLDWRVTVWCMIPRY